MAILDFSKTFDKVVHTRLISKLGFCGNVSDWIRSFLNNLTQQVMVSGAFSLPCPVTLYVATVKNKLYHIQPLDMQLCMHIEY